MPAVCERVALVAPAVGRIREAVAGTVDVVPLRRIVDCVRAYATVGEICQALREVYGTYEEVSIT